MGSNRKVVCSIGAGPHAELLAVSGQTFRVFAERHSYDVCLREHLPVPERPASWSKVGLIQELLADYDLVLWVDADAAFCDVSVDMASTLGADDLMGMVAHTTSEGVDRIPNAGIWLVRRHPGTFQFLEDVWNATRFIDHKWWENAAVLEELGYELEPRVRLVKPSWMYSRTRLLPNEWNSIAVDTSAAPRIVHFPAMALSDRLAGLRAAADMLSRSAQNAGPRMRP